uniref:HEPN_DZIP3 domain-containing protein n=1 Tax=Steinernema glaseri TaxID=37863 RepID=A0A1I7YCW8_9BILA
MQEHIHSKNSWRERRGEDPTDMDRVPLLFVESVVRSFHEVQTCKLLQQLSSAWGQQSEVHAKKSGRLLLTFAYTRVYRAMILCYKIEGFDHIESRTLSREVVKEISRTIRCIDLFLLLVPKFSEEWKSVGPDDVELLQLLVNLDAPEKRLDMDSFSEIFKESEVVKLRSKYSTLLKSFTSVKLQFSDARVMEETISEPRLRSVEIVDTGKAPQTTTFWVDLLFSEKCKRLSTYFSGVVLSAIHRWKKMDPGTLTHNRILRGILNSKEELPVVGMIKTEMEAEAALLEKLRSQLRDHRQIDSLHCMEHPFDPSSKTYVVFFNDRMYTDEVVVVFG